MKVYNKEKKKRCTYKQETFFLSYSVTIMNCNSCVIDNFEKREGNLAIQCKTNER